MTPRRLQPTRHAAHTLLTAPDLTAVATRRTGTGRTSADDPQGVFTRGDVLAEGRPDAGASDATACNRNLAS